MKRLEVQLYLVGLALLALTFWMTDITEAVAQSPNVNTQGGQAQLVIRINGEDFPVTGNVIEFRSNADLMLDVQPSKDGHPIVNLGFAYWNVDHRTQELINKELDRRMQAAPGGVSPPK